MSKEIKSKRCNFAYWELESILDASISEVFFQRYEDIFRNNTDCAMKLHHVINTRKIKEYPTFRRNTPTKLSDLLIEIKSEMRKNGLYEINSKHPLFELDDRALENCKAIRIQKDESLSVSFLISHFYEIFTKNAATGKSKPGKVMLTAGELSYKSYSDLKNMYFETLMNNAFNSITNFSFIAGPKISCPDGFDKESGNLEEANYILYLIEKFKKQHSFYHTPERVNFHSIVHEFDDSICLVEDYHKELKKRSTTIVFNSPELCDILKRRHYEASQNSTEIDLENNGKEQLIDILEEESGFE